MMKEEIGNASLYQKLQSTLYKYGAYKGAPDRPCGVGRADASPELLLNDR